MLHFYINKLLQLCQGKNIKNYGWIKKNTKGKKFESTKGGDGLVYFKGKLELLRKRKERTKFGTTSQNVKLF